MFSEDEPNETSPLLKSHPQAQRPLPYNGESSLASSTEGPDHSEVEHARSPDDSRAIQFAGDADFAKQLAFIVPAVGIGVFLAAADQTIIVSSYGRIGNDLHALNLTSFVATSYFLTLTSFQPLYGRLSDIFGRKTCLLYAYAIFGLGCLFCGLAQNIYQLIAARIFQGIGGGGMTTIVSIIFSDIIPLKDRGLWQGIINIIYASGAATGAPLGGALSDYVSWRFAFLFQAPLCLIAFVAVAFVLKLPAHTQIDWRTGLRRIDFLGALVLVCAVTGLIFGLDRGSNDSWSKPISYAPLGLSLLFFITFVYIEVKFASEPFAPGHIIFDRNILAAYLCNFFSFGAWLAVLYYLPLFYQAVDGLSATGASVRLLPSVCASVTGSLFAGIVMRKTGKFYWLTVGCYALLVVGLLLVFLFSGIIVNNWGLITLGTVLGGFGNGNGVTTTLIALISNAAPEDQAVVTACSYLFRSLGSVIGISLSATVIQQVLRMSLAEALGHGKQTEQIIRNVRQSLDYLKELDLQTQLLVRNAYGKAVNYGFACMLLFAIAAVVSSFFIKESRLS